MVHHIGSFVVHRRQFEDVQNAKGFLLLNKLAKGDRPDAAGPELPEGLQTLRAKC